MEHWSELRSALAVARLGTVQAAAEQLGVHRATINRHIDILERSLGVPLFYRHAKGYTLSDAGIDMMEIASRAEELFTDFAGRSTGSIEKLSGSLKITSLAGAAPLIMPLIDKFHNAFNEIELEFLADEQLARLEHGEAHIAIRAGDKPTTPDYVVLPFGKIRFGLYVSQDYIKNKGKPTKRNLHKHSFIGPLNKPTPLPYADWIKEHIRPDTFVLRVTNQQVINSAVQQGLGVGFVAEYDAISPKLIPIMSPSDDWSIDLWLVTHADLRRTFKVQSFIDFARLW